MVNTPGPGTEIHLRPARTSPPLGTDSDATNLPSRNRKGNEEQWIDSDRMERKATRKRGYFSGYVDTASNFGSTDDATGSFGREDLAGAAVQTFSTQQSDSNDAGHANWRNTHWQERWAVMPHMLADSDVDWSSDEVFPFFVMSMLRRVCYAKQNIMEKLRLHIWPGKWNLASIEPSCLAILFYLQLTAPEQFAVVECTNPDLSPTGHLPFLTYEHHAVASFPLIVNFVSSLKLKRPLQTAESEQQGEQQPPIKKTEMVAWCAHVESNMGDLVASMFYSLEENWWKLTKPALASMLPVPQRYYVPERLRDSYRPRLASVGLGNTPQKAPTEPEIKKTFTETIRRVYDEKSQFTRVFDREKVLEKARSHFDIYNRLLERGFLNHVRPTKLDILLAAHLLLLLHPPFPDPILSTLLRDSFPSLVDFARAIQTKASETPPPIPSPASPSYTWKSILPWSQPGRSTKTTKRSAEDIHFDRMRWGWMALATGSIFAYLWASGLRIVVMRQSEGDSDLPTDPLQPETGPLESPELVNEAETGDAVPPEPEETLVDILTNEDEDVAEEVAEEMDAKE